MESPENPSTLPASDAPAVEVAIAAADGQSLVRLRLEERYDADVDVAVDVVSHGFVASQTVLVEGGELGRFSQQLADFPGRRATGLSVSSISPDKFRLTFTRLQRGGQILVQVLLQRHGFWGEPRYAQTLAIAFEVPAEQLAALTAAFSVLGQAATQK